MHVQVLKITSGCQIAIHKLKETPSLAGHHSWSDFIRVYALCNSDKSSTCQICSFFFFSSDKPPIAGKRSTLILGSLLIIHNYNLRDHILVH